MKILVPLNNSLLLDRYSEAGADEFYMGFYDKRWEQIFGKAADINRMSGFGVLANKNSLEQTLDVIQEIRERHKEVYITLNAAFYSESQIQFIAEYYLPLLKKSGANGIIVSDLNLARACLSLGISTVASTMCSIYNSDIAAFYAEAGITRMILPRDLKLSEIELICAEQRNIDFEVFLMRNGCCFSDGYCLGNHIGGSVCGYLRHTGHRWMSNYISFEDKNSAETTKYLYDNFFHRLTACGLCAIYRFYKMNICSLKIVGRADDCERICEDIKLVKENIHIAEEANDESEYLRNMIFPHNKNILCTYGMNCYYPEVRFGGE